MVLNKQVPEQIALARHILALATRSSLVVRLVGGCAVWERCQSLRSTFADRRSLGDVDVVTRAADAAPLDVMLRESLGWMLDQSVGIPPFASHVRYRCKSAGYHLDVNVDSLRYSHCIDLRKRLDIHSKTVSATDLLISKLQVEHCTDKDLIDCECILLDLSDGSEDDDYVDKTQLRTLCSRNWGLERTFRQNVYKLATFVDVEPALGVGEKKLLAFRILELLEELDRYEKPLGWRFRALFGSWLRWREVVEECDHSEGPQK